MPPPNRLSQMDAQCPHCTLKMFCPHHPFRRRREVTTEGPSFGTHHANKKKPKDPATFDKLYRELVQAKLERYENADRQKEIGNINESAFWTDHLKKKRDAEDRYSKKERRKKRRRKSESEDSESTSSSGEEDAKKRRKRDRASKRRREHHSISGSPEERRDSRRKRQSKDDRDGRRKGQKRSRSREARDVSDRRST